MDSSQGQAKLVGVSGAYRSMEYLVTKDDYLIGRHPECDLVLKENTISGRHSRIQKVGGRFQISDLDSTNGTYLNGERVKQANLRHEDKIQFDVYEFIFFDYQDVGRTVISSAPPAGLQMPGKEPAAPSAEDKKEEEIATKMIDTGSKESQVMLTAGKGSPFLGWFFGLLIAAIVSGGGFSLVTWVQGGAQFNQALETLKTTASLFPFFHLHTFWKGGSWGPAKIICLLAVLLGPFLAGIVGGVISRRRGFLFSLSFSVCYVLLAVCGQLVVAKFKFAELLEGYAVAGLGILPKIPNFAAALAYFLVAVFFLHIVGSLFARRAKE